MTKINYKVITICLVIISTLLYFRIKSDRTEAAINSSSTVRVVTSDKIILLGRFKPPSHPDKPTLVLLHGLGSIKEEWDNFTRELEEEGYGYLIYDLRGHGASIKTTDNKEIRYGEFTSMGTDSHWKKMVDDLGRVIKYLQRTRKIRISNIAIAGASLGANICFIYASKNKSIPLTVCLSPGWEYAGLALKNSIPFYGNRPIFIAASPFDRFAYESSMALHELLSKSGSITKFLKGLGNRHGVNMLKGEFEKKLLDWIAVKTENLN